MEIRNHPKRKKPVIIAEAKTSLFVFLYPLLVFISSTYYAYGNNSVFYLIPLLSIAYMTMIFFFSFSGKKVFITNNKLYVYERGRKTISWDIVLDMGHCSYRRPFLGKIFGYGDLLISDSKNDFYLYGYLSGVSDFYSSFMKAYHRRAAFLNPEHEIPEEFSYKEIDSFKQNEKETQ